MFSILSMIINALVKPKQHISIPEIPQGKILDIGGGGEGVIAQVAGKRVIAIDKYMSEIREAHKKAPNATWVLADGTALPFFDDCLDGATAFFSCMYMSSDVKKTIFQETQRVLKNDGEIWVWDANMRLQSKVFAIRLKAEIPENRSINTVYGVKTKDQSVDRICEMLQEAGFEPEIISNHKYWFFVKAKKL